MMEQVKLNSEKNTGGGGRMVSMKVLQLNHQGGGSFKIPGMLEKLKKIKKW